MDRRNFVGMAAIAVMSPFLQPVADAQPTIRAKNIVLVSQLQNVRGCNCVLARADSR
jgi:hypothetical protein